MWTCTQVLPQFCHTPLGPCRQGVLVVLEDHIQCRCDSIGQHRTAPDMTGHQIGHFGHCSALHCPICTGHHRTLIGQSIGQSDTYRTPPPDSGPDIHRTFTGHSPDMTGHDRTVGHPGLRTRRGGSRLAIRDLPYLGILLRILLSTPFVYDFRLQLR